MYVSVLHSRFFVLCPLQRLIKFRRKWKYFIKQNDEHCLPVIDIKLIQLKYYRLLASTLIKYLLILGVNDID